MKNEKKQNLSSLCPIKHTIRLLGKRWTIMIIKELYTAKSKKLSFMDLMRKLDGTSSKVLSDRLKEMAVDGLVNRKEDTATIPSRVNYSLTKKGKDACDILDAFKEYGIKWGADKVINCKKVDCELCPNGAE